MRLACENNKKENIALLVENELDLSLLHHIVIIRTLGNGESDFNPVIVIRLTLEKFIIMGITPQPV